MPIVISAEDISKAYRLGQIGTGTLANDLHVWWAKLRGKPNPLLKIGQEDHGNHDGEMIWALKDINFTVEQGEVLGIIGRNGAGKSTLLKILSRVTAPTSGCIKVKGRIASLLEVGTGFHPDLTGRENVYLNGAILGMTKEEVSKKLDEIVAFSEIEQFLNTPVKRYSSGMYVRLAFAVAAHLESEILLVDEVLAVGDQEFQKKCLGKMGDVAKAGRTVFFVSHNLGAIRNLCTKGILLKNGRMASSGITADVIGEYLGGFHESSGYLADWKDRQGNGNSRLERISINGGLTEKTQAIYTGGSVVFKFFVSRVLPRLECTFNIYDDLGVAIARFSSGLKSEFDTINNEDPKCFSCYVKELPLSPGHYRVNVAISNDGVLQDRVENAATLIIESSNYGGRKINFSQTAPRITLNHQWMLPPAK